MIVALHGFTGAPESWQELLPRAHRPLLTGHGAAPDLTSRSFEEEISRLAREIAAEPGPRSLVGYSLGARLALGLALRAPELFEDVTLIGGSPGLASEEERRARREADASWIRLLEEEGLEPFVDAWERAPLFASQVALPPESARAQRRVRSSHTARGLAHSLRVTGLGVMPDLRGGLRALPLELRLIVGERDTKFRALAEEMRALAPRARLDLVPEAGHNPLLDNPRGLAPLLPSR